MHTLFLLVYWSCLPVGVFLNPLVVSAPSPPTSQPAAAPDLDFSNFEQSLMPTSTPPALDFVSPDPDKLMRDHLAKKRRRMLNVHQALGFSLLGVMGLNLVLGHLNYHDKFMGGGFTNRYEIAHLVTSVGTSALFAGNGLLALFAPQPYAQKGGFDSARFHRIAMIVSTALMVGQIVLGPVSAARIGHLDQRSLATAHLVLGYMTYGVLTAGALAYVF